MPRTERHDSSEIAAAGPTPPRTGELAQIPRNLLFRFRFPCHKSPAIDVGRPFELSAEHRLGDVGRLEGRPAFADWRLAWNQEGLYLTAHVQGKSQTLWCRPNQILESDGLQVWIDTRDTHNVHRATRYCHWFVLMPTGPQGREPANGRMLKINRAREDAPTINRGPVTVHSVIDKRGYRLACWIPGSLLNGWSPMEQPQIGFFMAQVDRELGWQTLGVGPELPFMENPSLWQSLWLREENAPA